MLPRANMVAIKNSPRRILLLLLTALLAGGCTAPGPRALLEGDELLRGGKIGPAIAELRRATELLPGEPRAWNLLGLAYHRAGQPQAATQAYRQALLRDRSNLVAVAHFNLGCLLLEQNSPVGAVDALRSYTLLTNSPPGFARLGSAQLRLRQLAEAEKSFVTALRWDAKNPEALNGLGLVRAARGQRDAAQYFDAARQADPKYSPALLNAAVVAQQNPATKTTALQRYRDYLAVAGSTPRVEPVKLLVRQLEAELTPAPAPVPPAKIADAPRTNAPAAPAAVVAKSNAPAVTPVAVVKTNAPALAAKTNPPAPALAVTNKPAAPVTPPPVTVVSVTESAPPKIGAAEIPSVSPQPRPPAATPTRTTRPTLVADAKPSPVISETTTTVAPPEKKRGFFSKLNPFSGKPKAEATREESRMIIVNPDALLIAAENAPRAPGEKPEFPRYRYLAPTPPAPGDRATAERALQQALAAQRAGRTIEASSGFANAVTADPSYFDAQYNAALLAFQSGDAARALPGWETALALQPDSISARYSFALSLKQAGHADDAAAELEKIVEAKPDDARAHLALGNLYAQQLLETPKARAHYKKFLELEPRHAQAATIRYWLSANP